MFNKINGGLNILTKTCIITGLFLVIVLFLFVTVKPVEQAYTRVETISCNTIGQLMSCKNQSSQKTDCKSECKFYGKLEKINIKKILPAWFKVIDLNGKHTYIAAEDVIFENTPEFEQVKSQNTDYQQNDTNIARKWAEAEPEIKKVFVSTDIKPDLYCCYVKQHIWNAFSFPQKQKAFRLCGEYGKYKSNQLGEELSEMQVKTKIKNFATKKIFAEYNIKKGIIIK